MFGTYCLYVSAASVRRLRGADAYYLAGGDVAGNRFAFGAMAAVISGWAVFGLPGLVGRGGFPAAYLSMLAIVLALFSVLFMKRLWVLSRLFKARSLPELLAKYYGARSPGILAAVVVILAAIILQTLILAVAGDFLSSLTGGRAERNTAIILFALLTALSVAPSGFKGVVTSSPAHVWIFFGLSILGAGLVVSEIGGWDKLKQGLVALSTFRDWGDSQGRGGGDYSLAQAVPGAIQFISGFKASPAESGPIIHWTGAMIFSVSMALAGTFFVLLQTPWTFAARDPRIFSRHQAISLAIFGGVILGLSAVIFGLGGLMIDRGVTQTYEADRSTALLIFSAYLPTLKSFWAKAVFGVLGIAVLHLMSITLMASLSASTQSFWRLREKTRPKAPSGEQEEGGERGDILIGQIAAIAAIVTASVMALAEFGDFPDWGGFSATLGLQLTIGLLGVCWLPWITRPGMVLGMTAGIAAAALTEPIGLNFLLSFTVPPWGVWPSTIHSAVWGLAANGVVCIAVSVVTQNPKHLERRTAYHTSLQQFAGIAPERRERVALAWTFVAAWLFFAIGPGAVFGNEIFGKPSQPPAMWDFGQPSIFVWQVLMWVLGVFLVWYLARGLELSTITRQQLDEIDGRR